MSNYSKGKRNERKAVLELIDLGYEIMFKSRFVRFQNVDFGPFDIVAFHPITRAREYVQVKSSLSGVSEAKKKIGDWVKTYGMMTPTIESYEIWLYLPRKPKRTWEVWTIPSLNPFDRETVVTETTFSDLLNPVIRGEA